jgi:hypothetical protein
MLLAVKLAYGCAQTVGPDDAVDGSAVDAPVAADEIPMTDIAPAACGAEAPCRPSEVCCPQAYVLRCGPTSTNVWCLHDPACVPIYNCGLHDP